MTQPACRTQDRKECPQAGRPMVRRKRAWTADMSRSKTRGAARCICCAPSIGQIVLAHHIGNQDYLGTSSLAVVNCAANETDLPLPR